MQYVFLVMALLAAFSTKAEHSTSHNYFLLALTVVFSAAAILANYLKK